MPQTNSTPVRVVESRFMLGTDQPMQLPMVGIPEIAFIGRTNVGKSTLINRVTSRRSLARASATPGRTQEFNLFSAAVKCDEWRKDLLFVDLPGFGYSKFSVKKRIFLEKATYLYLNRRPSLSMVCLLNDIRRNPEEEEREVLTLTHDRGIPALIVLTKSDKLTARQRAIRKREIIEHYALDESLFFLMGSDVDGNTLVARIVRALDLLPNQGA